MYVTFVKTTACPSHKAVSAEGKAAFYGKTRGKAWNLFWIWFSRHSVQFSSAQASSNSLSISASHLTKKGGKINVFLVGSWLAQMTVTASLFKVSLQTLCLHSDWERGDPATPFLTLTHQRSVKYDLHSGNWIIACSQTLQLNYWGGGATHKLIKKESVY